MKIPKDYIHHHTLFDRTTMEQRPEARQWRRSSGMIMIMPRTDEQILHRELDGLPRPSQQLARRALDYLAVLPPEYDRMRRFMGVTALMWDITDRYTGSTRAKEARLFAEHFQNQQIFMRDVWEPEARKLF